MSYYEQYKVNVPEGECGPWKVKRFELTENDARLSLLRDGGRFTSTGTYTGLYFQGRIIMSDTPAEVRDHLYFMQYAYGDVLIHGLGLGMCLQNVARKENVRSVLVIEKSPLVIDLVAPTYQAMFPDKVEIRQGDALTWKPAKGQCWNVIWHDIWDDINEDNYEEMKTLQRRFGRFCSWQDCWSRKEILSRRRTRKTRSNSYRF